MKNIGIRLKDIRLDYKLTQVDFSKRLGVTHAHISKIEKGKTVPSESLVRLICKEYGINILWLKNGQIPIHIKPTQQFNQLPKNENAIIRAQSEQVNMPFEFISNNINKELYLQCKTQKWLADRCGVTKGQINHIVHGRSLPSFKLLAKISLALGVEASSLIVPTDIQQNVGDGS